MKPGSDAEPRLSPAGSLAWHRLIELTELSGPFHAPRGGKVCNVKEGKSLHTEQLRRRQRAWISGRKKSVIFLWKQK